MTSFMEFLKDEINLGSFCCKFLCFIFQRWLKLLLPSNLNVACDHSYLLGDVCNIINNLLKCFNYLDGLY